MGSVLLPIEILPLPGYPLAADFEGDIERKIALEGWPFLRVAPPIQFLLFEDASLAKGTASAGSARLAERDTSRAAAGAPSHAPASAGNGRFKPVVLVEIQTGADMGI